MSQALPLLFRFQQLVAGAGYVAVVRMSGRALLEDESGEFWITGIEPAGFAGGGLTREAAFDDFKTEWARCLFDIAAEAPTFEAFDNACQEFLRATVDHLDRDWHAAHARVKDGSMSDDRLPRVAVESVPIGFEIIRVVPELSNPRSNEVDQQKVLVAA